MTEITTSWERKGNCESNHEDDIPLCHSGGTDYSSSVTTYRRHYEDGCVKVEKWKTKMP